MLGSSLVLIFGLILLWRRRVPAYINAFTGQSIALVGVAGATGYFGNEAEFFLVVALLLDFKRVVIPALLLPMGGSMGRDGVQGPYGNIVNSQLTVGLLE